MEIYFCLVFTLINVCTNFVNGVYLLEVLLIFGICLFHCRYNDLPRPAAQQNKAIAEASHGTLVKSVASHNSRGMSIARYFTPVSCVACGATTMTAPTSQGPGLCPDCKTKPQTTVLCLNEKIRSYERALEHLGKVCVFSFLILNVYIFKISTFLMCHALIIPLL